MWRRRICLCLCWVLKIQRCRKKATPGSRDPAACGGSGKTFFFPLCWLKQGGGIAEVNILYCLCKLPLENTSPRCFLDVFVVNELPIPFSVARRQGSADTSFRPLFCISSVSLFFCGLLVGSWFLPDKSGERTKGTDVLLSLLESLGFL